MGSIPIKPEPFLPIKETTHSKAGTSPALTANLAKAPVADAGAISHQKTALSQAAPSLTAGEVFRAAAAALNIPPDLLSYHLLNFARFFSLSPETDLLTSLRKEILAGAGSSPKTDREKAVLEARSLAAMAAADKGVQLSQECLVEYSGTESIINPDGGDSYQGERRKEEQRNSRDKSRDESRDEKDSSEAPGPPSAAKNSTPDAEALQKIFGSMDQNRGKKQFFDLLNRIPGKNGQRWIVWPFNYSAGGTELKVFVRILIKEHFSFDRENAETRWIIADLSGPGRNWHFLLNRTEEEKIKLELSVFPGFPPGELKTLKKELEKHLGALAAITEISVRNGEEYPSLAQELECKALPSVNEEV